MALTLITSESILSNLISFCKKAMPCVWFIVREKNAFLALHNIYEESQVCTWLLLFSYLFLEKNTYHTLMLLPSPFLLIYQWLKASLIWQNSLTLLPNPSIQQLHNASAVAQVVKQYMHLNHQLKAFLQYVKYICNICSNWNLDDVLFTCIKTFYISVIWS